jgi:hypothetical protein
MLPSVSSILGGGGIMLCLDGGVIIRRLIPCKGKFYFFSLCLLALYQAAEHGPWAEIVFAFVYGVGTRLCGAALPRIGGMLLMTSLSLVSKIPEPCAHLLICTFFL